MSPNPKSIKSDAPVSLSLSPAKQRERGDRGGGALRPWDARRLGGATITPSMEDDRQGRVRSPSSGS